MYLYKQGDKEMKDKLIQVIKDTHDSQEKRFNPDFFVDSKRMSDEGMLIVKSLIGNLFVKGYSEESRKNFEVFKDSENYRIRLWVFDSNKPETFTFMCNANEMDIAIKYIQDSM
ncbi:hypothetical protein XaC1_45 [Xanthomonas phage XaC1]|nr:hypothetical protein XaC1_45 [Xanthomonas phage XaC1]